MNIKKLYSVSIILFIFFFSSSYIQAQNTHLINPDLLKNKWTAKWITAPNNPSKEYGVFHFRKNFVVNEMPHQFVVNVSADNRYRLFVNGKAVGAGPARGDLYNWYYETIDIAPYLVKGNNTIAAQVWNMGVLAPVAQISNQTAFLLQGNGVQESIVNTNAQWKVFKNESYFPCSTNNGERLRSYMVVGPGDSVVAQK